MRVPVKPEPVNVVRMPNGDLQADPGGPIPADRPGYIRDAFKPHRLRKLAAETYHDPRNCCRGL